MSLYLDASVLLPVFVAEPASTTVQGFLQDCGSEILVSDFAAAEVASAISRLVRTHRMEMTDGQAVLEDFDAWRAAMTTGVDLQSADVRLAAAYVRRFELMLRTPDALHLAACRRLGTPLATLDRRLAWAAAELGVEVGFEG